MGLGHPCVALLELGRWLRRGFRRGEDDSLHTVEDVERERGVYR